MGLIKSADAPSTMVAFSMADIERHAKGILLRARQQAEQLIADAQVEAEGLKTRAQAEGLAEGRRQGTAAGLAQGKEAGHQQALTEHRAQLQQAVAAFTAAATAIDQSRNALEADALAEVVKLSVAVARRVTKRQGVVDPSVLTANLHEAMNLVVKSTDVRVAINPAQRKTLDDALPRLGLRWPALAHVRVIEEPALAPGGCRVFTEHGRIDADLDAQLDRIAAELLPAPEAAPCSAKATP